MHPPGHGRAVAGMLAAAILAIFTVFSAGSITHGFVAYYTASRLLVSGELGPIAYDDRWFGEKVQQLTASSVREIFTPNPPTMALMALPVAGLDAQRARAVARRIAHRIHRCHRLAGEVSVASQSRRADPGLARDDAGARGVHQSASARAI